jgi:hypothetical protein
LNFLHVDVPFSIMQSYRLMKYNTCLSFNTLLICSFSNCFIFLIFLCFLFISHILLICSFSNCFIFLIFFFYLSLISYRFMQTMLKLLNSLCVRFRGLSLSICHLCFLKIIHCLIGDQPFYICFDNLLFYFIFTFLLFYVYVFNIRWVFFF